MLKSYTLKYFSGIVLLLALLFVGVHDVRASHAVGVDLTYECLGGGQYRVTLSFYRDCDGVSAPNPTAPISISSAQCGVSTSTSLTLQNGFPIEVSPYCVAQQGNSSCNGGNLPGIQQYVYQGVITLPPGCGSDWIFSYGLCCRNSAITNLQSASSQNIYVQATLDNTTPTCNSSPIFTTLPVPYLCAGQPFNYNHGAIDFDGDSLVYTLVNALDGRNAPIGYTGGFSPTNPMATSSGFGFDQATGQMGFTPSQTQQAVVTVRVDEYRNGVLVGSVIRDLQLVVLNCSNNVPTATGIDGAPSGGGAQAFAVDICAGFPLCFDIFTNDADPGDQITMTYNNGIPAGTFTVGPGNNPTATFCWTPTPADVGTHNFSVEVSDGACLIEGINVYTYTVNVIANPNPPVQASPDVTICTGDCTPLSASVSGGGPGIQYEWTPSTGLSCTNCPNPTACPTQSIIYTVSATYPDACVSTDQVSVTVNPTPTVSVYPQSASICTGGSITLGASGSSTVTSYVWQPGNLTGQSITVSPTTTTTYTVTAFDAFGCPSAPASSTITLNPPPPAAVCNNIYVTPNGTGGGLSPTDPTSLANALVIGACNNVTIKMAVGTYPLNSPLTGITSYMTLEGGFDSGNNWRKTSSPGATTIFRNNTNLEDVGTRTERLVGVYLNTVEYVRFQDITIQTANCTGNGVSNYGVHMTACSNYDFVRTQVIAGNASGGSNGVNGANGLPGANGGNGTGGNSDNDARPGEGGNGGNGGSGVAGGQGGNDTNGGGCCQAGPVGANGTNGTGRNGGAGGGGGTGGEGNNNGGRGGRGGSSLQGAGGNWGNGGSGGDPGGQGFNGANGINGANGADGADGLPGAHVGPFFQRGTNGTNGADGRGGTGGGGGGGGGGQNAALFGNDGAGDGGGGGGGGGQGGQGGTGATAGGAPFAVYLFNNGANGRFDDCQFFVGLSGAPGFGGNGGNGANGGIGGLGASTNPGEIGQGGQGGTGGRGGDGGRGGSTYGGSAVLVHRNGGSVPVVTDYNYNLNGQPIITAENISCTFEDIDFTGPTSAAWNFGSGASPLTGSGTAPTTQYTTVGRKNVTYNANTYTGFVYMAIDASVFRPDIQTTAILVSPGVYRLCEGEEADFLTSTLATQYNWNMGGAATPNTYTTQNVFQVQFNTAGTYTISLDVVTDCCGQSLPETITLIVDPQPTVSLSGSLDMCQGSNTTLTASGAATYSWTPNVSISQDTGNVVTFNPPQTTNYIVTGFNASGTCFFELPFTITVNENPVLTTSSTQASCTNDGTVTVNASGGSGNFTYEWNTVPPQFTATATGLPPNNYGVTVTDAVTGCTTETFQDITSIGAPIPFVQNVVDVTCNGDSTGYAVATTFNGTAPFAYTWSSGAVGDTAFNLPFGNISVTVTDANGCTNTASAFINQPDSLTVVITDTINATCFGFANGLAVASADGGAGNYTYAWNTVPPQSGDTARNLAAGTYTVTATDDFGCTIETSVTITEPPALVLNLNNQVDILCFGDSTGILDVSASGGSGSGYTYALNGGTPQGSGLFNNLPAGNYAIEVVDGSGCDSTFNYTITEPAELILTVTADSVSCFGLSDGQINASAVGGVPTLRYRLNGAGPFQFGGTFSNLGQGSYLVEVFDGNNCIDDTTVTIEEPPLLTLSAVQDSVLCAGDSTGSIIATAGGGAPGYQFTIDGGTTYQTSDTFASLPAGLYTVEVLDNNGCTETVTIDVLEPTPVNLTLVQDSVSCNGLADGEITATVSGGVPPYQYSIDGGATYQGNGVFSGLLAGWYTIDVLDDKGCTFTDSIEVLQPDALTIGLAGVDILCFSNTTGSVTATVTGGTTPYQYSIDGGTTFQPGNVFGNLGAGSYTVLVLDNNGCSVQDSIILTEPTDLSISAVQDSVSCFNGNDGSITATGAGGVGNYEYNLNGGAWSANNVFTGLTGSTYQIGVRDGNGCLDSVTITVLQPAQLSLSLAQDSADCFRTFTGEITATAAGGTPPYTYSLDGVQPVSNNVFTGLGAKVYTVEVFDFNGCSFLDSIEVLQPLRLTMNLSTTDVTCSGLADGSITATVAGGTLDYQYSIDGGSTYQTSNVFNGLTAGTYVIDVVDQNGCTVTDSATITEPTALGITLVQDSVDCNGAATGEITATVTGGTTPYQYSIDGGSTYQLGNVFSGLTAGPYTIDILDGNNCTVSANIDVLEPAVLTISLAQDSVDCNGAATGEITATVTGGTLDYQYSIDGGSTYQNSNVFSGLTAGAYTIDVIDQNGCTISDNITVLEPVALSLTLLQDSADCFGAADGEITATVTGGTLDYQYSIDGGSTYQNSNVFSGLTAGMYTVDVIDQNGCSITDSIEVLEPMGMTITLAQDSASCNGLADGSVTATVVNGIGALQYSLDGGATYQGSNVFNGLSAGTYVVQVLDASGCTLTDSIDVLEPDVLTVTLVQDSASCFGAADGEITATVTGGTLNYQYSIDGGNTYQTNNVFSGLTAGSYTIDAIDQNGCTASATIDVLEPAALAITLAQDSANCAGAADGEITATVTGGTLDYQYSIDGGSTYQTSNVFSGLSAGAYTIDVIDQNGCTISDNITVLEPAALGIQLGQDSANCFGAADGEITAFVNGGTIDYQYSIDGGNTYQTSNVFTGLVAGPYTIDVIDQNGCTISDNITVLEPTDVTLSLVQDSASCSGLADGEVTATAGGGTPPYTYSIDGGTTTQPGNVFTGLLAGSYTVDVTDFNGCTESATITVLEPQALAVTLVQDSANCFGIADGEITATVTGGTATYQYSIDGGATYQAGNVFSGLAAGPYTIDVLDFNGCTASANITVLEPTAVQLTLAQDSVNCTGGSDGIISATATGGTPTYRYSIDGGTTFQASSDFTGLSAGAYTILVEDLYGCSTTAQIDVLEPTVVTIALTQDSVNCFGGTDGAITVTGGGGTPPYTYAINGGTPQTSNTFTGLSAANYLVDVIDAYGCTASDNITVLQPTQVTVSAVQDSASCFGGNDGTITATGAGGTATYEYNLDNGPYQASNVFTGLTAGTYTVGVRDFNDCVNSTTVTVLQPSQIVLSLSKTDVSCFGGTDGTANVAVSGGSGGYTYAWSNGGAGALATGFSAGYATVTVTDGNGCASIDSILIDEPTQVEVSGTTTDVSCYGGNDGTIILTVTGGTPSPNYTFQWAHGPTTSSLNQLWAGNYDVVVTDGNGCTAAASFTIIEPTDVVLDADSMDVTCFAGDNGIANVYATGGTAPYTYAWNTTPAQNTSSATGLTAGNYLVTVTDANGCVKTTNVIVNEPTAVEALVTGVDPLCADGSDGSINVIPGGGTPDYTYTWSHDALADGEVVSDLPADEYTVTVTDANGCTFESTVELNNPAPIGVTISADETEVAFGRSVELSTTLSDNVSGVPSYEWSPSDLLSCIACGTPEAGPLLESTIFTVNIIDENGCEATDLIQINVDQYDKVLWAPNAFTANGDGLNDEFLIYGYGFKEFELLIFDRWGAKLFESSDQTEGWDGRFNGELLMPGVYVFYTRVEYLDGETKVLKGSVTLLR